MILETQRTLEEERVWALRREVPVALCGGVHLEEGQSGALRQGPLLQS